MKSKGSEDKALIVVDSDHMPEELPILQVENQVAFPGLNMTLAISNDALALVESEMNKNRIVGVMGVKKSSDISPTLDQIRGVGSRGIRS